MESEKAAPLLYDSNVGLPTFLGVLDQLERLLVENSALGMLYIDISKINRVEETHGTPTMEKVLRDISSILQSTIGKVIRTDDILTVAEVDGTDFMVFLAEKRKNRETFLLTREDVETVSDRVQTFVFSKIFYALYPYLKVRPRISVGYSFVVNNPLIKPRRLIYNLVDEAKTISKLQYNRVKIKTKEKLQRIILEEDITTLYQPIVDLNNFSIIGYEALTRGPKLSEFENPLMLFSLAQDAGLLFELDRVCRKKALFNAKDLPEGMKLFINTLPTTINDPEFHGSHLRTFLEEVKIDPSKIVFEITEHSAVENLALFREAVGYFSEMGISFAIDDMGTGYSNLESIIELRPRYLKFDLSMVKDIHRSLLKREMLTAIQNLARSMNAITLAEGIENKEDLITLRELGVQLGQGYFFAKPGPGFPDISPSSLA